MDFLKSIVDNVKNSFTRERNENKEVFEKAGEALDYLKERYAKAKENDKGGLYFGFDIVGNLFETITAPGSAQKIVDIAAAPVKGVVNNVEFLATSVLPENIGGGISKVGDEIINFGKDLYGSLGEAATSIVKGGVDLVKDTAGKLVDPDTKNIGQKVLNAGSTLLKGGVNLAKGAVEGFFAPRESDGVVAKTFKQIPEKVTSGIQEFIPACRNFLVEFGKGIGKNVEVLYNGAKKFASDAIENGKHLVSGVAEIGEQAGKKIAQVGEGAISLGGKVFETIVGFGKSLLSAGKEKTADLVKSFQEEATKKFEEEQKKQEEKQKAREERKEARQNLKPEDEWSISEDNPYVNGTLRTSDLTKEKQDLVKTVIEDLDADFSVDFELTDGSVFSIEKDDAENVKFYRDGEEISLDKAANILQHEYRTGHLEGEFGDRLENIIDNNKKEGLFDGFDRQTEFDGNNKAQFNAFLQAIVDSYGQNR